MINKRTTTNFFFPVTAKRGKTEHLAFLLFSKKKKKIAGEAFFFLFQESTDFFFGKKMQL